MVVSPVHPLKNVEPAGGGSSDAVQCKPSLPRMVMVFPVLLLAWPVLPKAGLSALGACGMHMQPLTRVREGSWSHNH